MLSSSSQYTFEGHAEDFVAVQTEQWAHYANFRPTVPFKSLVADTDEQSLSDVGFVLHSATAQHVQLWVRDI